jgi:hypothetical protein
MSVSGDSAQEVRGASEHHRESLRRWFSKDVSRAVLYKAPCPVWYVPGQRAA